MAKQHVSMKAELDAVGMMYVRRLLRPVFAKPGQDLRQRLGFFGYDMRDGFLVTAPHGKKVCPISAI